MGATALIHQQQYRWKNDTGDETSTDWAAALNTAIAPALNSIYRLRIQLSTGIGAVPSITPRLRVSKDGGGYTEITTSTTDVKAIASSEAGYVDGTNTTEQLAGSQTFSNGGSIVEDGVGGGMTFAAQEDREMEYVVQFLTSGTFDFRVYHDGAGPIDTYPVTPQAVIAAAGGSGHVVGGGCGRVIG